MSDQNDFVNATCCHDESPYSVVLSLKTFTRLRAVRRKGKDATA
jgi:hypothetical protein